MRIVKEQNRIKSQLSIYMNSCQGVETLFSAPLAAAKRRRSPQVVSRHELAAIEGKTKFAKNIRHCGQGVLRGAHSASGWHSTPDFKSAVPYRGELAVDVRPCYPPQRSFPSFSRMAAERGRPGDGTSVGKRSVLSFPPCSPHCRRRSEIGPVWRPGFTHPTRGHSREEDRVTL